MNFTRVKIVFAVALSALALSGCVSHFAASSEYDAIKARAPRVIDLLQQCTGGGAPQAQASIAEMNAILGGLDQAYGEVIVPEMGSSNAGQQMVGAPFSTSVKDWNTLVVNYHTAQAKAYDAAVACGLVAPGYPDPGSWSATWTDFSS